MGCGARSTVYHIRSNFLLLLLCTENNGVSGRLPSELEQLTELRFFLLEIGAIAGTIPTEIATLQNLEVIDLDFNLIQGPIPEELYGLSNLKQLDINNNGEFAARPLTATTMKA